MDLWEVSKPSGLLRFSIRLFCGPRREEMHYRVGTSAGPSGDCFLGYANRDSTFDCRLSLIDQSLPCPCSESSSGHPLILVSGLKNFSSPQSISPFIQLDFCLGFSYSILLPNHQPTLFPSHIEPCFLIFLPIVRARVCCQWIHISELRLHDDVSTVSPISGNVFASINVEWLKVTGEYDRSREFLLLLCYLWQVTWPLQLFRSFFC